MPRNKKGLSTQRGSRRGRGRGHGRSSSVPYASHALRPNTNVEFTLADEARHTSQHDPSLWGYELRRKPVSFISAGSSNPLKLTDEIPTENAPMPTPRESQSIIPFTETNLAYQKNLTPPPPSTPVHEAKEPPIEECFSFDVDRRQPTTQTRGADAKTSERPLSRDSSSSDEVILFQGRNAAKRKPRHGGITTSIIHTEIQTTNEVPVVARQHRHQATEACGAKTLEIETRPHGRRKRRGRGVDGEEEAILADYIANIRESEELTKSPPQHAYNQADLSGVEFDMSELSTTVKKCTDEARSLRVMTSDQATDDDSDQEDGPHDLSTDDTDGPLDKGHQLESEPGHDMLARLISSTDLSANSAEDEDQLSLESEFTVGPEHIDQTHDFDFMNWERPSLRRRRGKGAQAMIQFPDHDPELEQRLQTAWKNDRLKKSQRRKLREEQRALGMLGKKAGPTDLRIKYPTGMSVHQVAEELKTFLLGVEETISLPPMDKHARKMVHELANKFNVKSKSVGKADQRRPSLYRTGRTLPFRESDFDDAIHRINRKFFPRLDLNGKHTRGTPARTSHAATTYRDGEVVGATAPELGAQNRGRTMLEKMGWSTGTALGSTDNKGILQPVTHTMKRTKAGLG